MYCLAAIHFPEKKRKENVALLVLLLLLLNCKKEGKAISFID